MKSISLILAVFIFSLASLPSMVSAVSCGDTITSDTVLTNDLLDCSNQGILIGDDKIVLDCDNHVIEGRLPVIQPNITYGIHSYGWKNLTIKNCFIRNFSVGMGIFSSGQNVNISNINITKNTISNSDAGIMLSNTLKSTISNNYINSTSLYGITISYSKDNIIEDNVLENNFYSGIDISSSKNNIISKNNITNNYAGITLYGGHENITSSSDNIIIHNNINSNNKGIFLVFDIGKGVFSNTTIYNNYFQNQININKVFGTLIGPIFLNTTKRLGKNIIGGPFIGGNFWSDYNGQDTNLDGIGDTNLPYNANGVLTTGGDYLPLAKPIIICIDPGHGGIYSGAIGIDGPSYPNESHINLAISSKLRDILVGNGFNVIMTRTSDEELVIPLSSPPSELDLHSDLVARAKFCNDRNADVFISVHANSVDDSSVIGTSTFYLDDIEIQNPETNTERYKLAKSIFNDVIETARTKQYYTGVIADYEFLGYNLRILSESNISATTLIEVAFMSNQGDFGMLNNYMFKEAAATGIYNGLVDYFGYPDKIILDSDKDGIINSQDKCPYDSSQGYDSNNDGCKDLTPPSTTPPSQPKKIIKIF